MGIFLVSLGLQVEILIFLLQISIKLILFQLNQMFETSTVLWFSQPPSSSLTSWWPYHFFLILKWCLDKKNLPIKKLYIKWSGECFLPHYPGWLINEELSLCRGSCEIESYGRESIRDICDLYPMHHLLEKLILVEPFRRVLGSWFFVCVHKDRNVPPQMFQNLISFQ